MVVPPWLILTVILALTLAVLYQLATRRWGWRVIAYWLVTLAGILLAEALTEAAGWNVSRVGDLRVLPDALGGVSVVAILWFFGL